MTLPALTRKAFRDLWHLRGPAVAIGVVAMCGVAAFVTLRSMVAHLERSQQAYYRSNRFGHLFAHVRRAPRAELARIASLPGVAAVDGWVSGNVVLDVPGLAEPAAAKVVGLLPDSPARVNRVTILRGRAPEEGSRSDVVVSEGFADANRLRLGDTLSAVVNGTWRRLRVAGVGLSPEFIYEIRPGDIFPDARRYGILWMDHRVVEADFGMTGEWNDLAVLLTPGATAPTVRDALDRMLDTYGTFGAYDRDRHASHRYVSEEINQNRTSAAVVPTIFLGVAAFLISLVLARIVQSQREQIGMLKAFGCRTPTLVGHYLLIAVIPVAAGAIAGCGLGLWAAHGIAGMYREFFHFPFARFTPQAGVLVVGVLAAVVAAAVGAATAVRRVAKLAPADAMRPEPPATYSRGTVERFGLDQLLGPVGRMTARSMLRRPVRTGLSVLGLGLGASVMIVGMFSFDAVDVLRALQFDVTDREDVTVAFDAPRGPGVLYELARLPGVTRVEATRALAVRLRHGGRERQVGLLGAERGAALRRIVALNGAIVEPPPDGLMVNAALSRLLGLRSHDTVSVELLEGRRTRHDVVVTAIVEDMLGTGAWMDASALERLAGTPAVITGATLAADPARAADLYRVLKRTPGVSGVAVRRALRENFDALVRRSFTLTLSILVAFACAIAIGVVYNGARITLAERSRELASLRVLGFTQGEVGRMLEGEQATLTVASLPIGAGIGAALAWGTVRAMGSTELWRMPFVISARTFMATALMIVVSSLLAGLLVRRRLDRVDLVAVLKTRE